MKQENVFIRFGDKEITHDHTEISFNWEGAVWKPLCSKSSTDKARSLRSNLWIWQSLNGLEKQTYKQAPFPWHLERQGFKNFEYELRKNNSMESREGKSYFYDGITLYVLIAWWERDRTWELEDTRPMEEVSEWNGRKHNLKGGGTGLGEETSFSQKPRASWEQIKVFGSSK